VPNVSTSQDLTRRLRQQLNMQYFVLFRRRAITIRPTATTTQSLACYRVEDIRPKRMYVPLATKLATSYFHVAQRQSPSELKTRVFYVLVTNCEELVSSGAAPVLPLLINLFLLRNNDLISRVKCGVGASLNEAPELQQLALNFLATLF